MPTPSVQQLERAIEISEQLEQLQYELSSLLSGASFSTSKPIKAAQPETEAPASEAPTPRKRGRKPGRQVSPEARAKMAAAQKARWARARGGR